MQSQLRQDMALIRDAALDAVDPYVAVKRHLRREGERVIVGERHWSLKVSGERRRVVVLSIGKAAAPMAAAAADILGDALAGGVVVTKVGHAEGYTLPDSLEQFEAGHPIPDAVGIAAGAACLRALQDVTDQDLVLVLLSGGGSALLPAPVDGVTLDDMQSLTDLLLRAGANIVELNAVRKHLSRIKGGQLARHAAPAPVVSLILSDVVGDPLDVIASGPTAPDPTTYEDAREILTRYVPQAELPAAVTAHLKAGCEGDVPETPKPDDPRFAEVQHILVGSNAVAAKAAVVCAEELGYRGLLLTTFVEGEAREVAKVAVALAKGVRHQSQPLSAPACLVWGGETTVTVTGEGKGGRNQELALAAALAMAGLDGVTLMALATDGTDGPTDAAGAVVDGSSAQRARDAGWNPRSALEDNNAYPLLAATGDLLRLGPTGTNVNDLLVVLVH